MSDTKLNIYQKLSKLRVELQSKGLKKSGQNKFANFDYFELKDFLETTNKLMHEIGLTPVFNLTEEKASLVLYDHDSDQRISFYTPVGQAMKSGVEIQDIGARHTYAKRYLYMNLLELAENDSVDATVGKEVKPKTKPTGKPTVENMKNDGMPKPKATLYQIKEVQEKYSKDIIDATLKKYNVSEIGNLPFEVLEKMIAHSNEIKTN